MLNFIIFAEGAVEHHEQPTAWLLTPGGWVALSMLAVFAIMLKAKVPAMIAAALDKKIAGIRSQLEAAASLRREAEELRSEYEAKLAALNDDAVAMRQRAEQDAAAVIAKASDDAKALIARRQQMAEDRIAAAERSAIAEVRNRVANAAVDAARLMIVDGHNVAADKPLVDRAIANIANP